MICPTPNKSARVRVGIAAGLHTTPKNRFQQDWHTTPEFSSVQLHRGIIDDRFTTEFENPGFDYNCKLILGIKNFNNYIRHISVCTLKSLGVKYLV